MAEHARDEVGVYDARASFAKLLERAEAGEEIIITRHGRAIAMLSPAPAPRPRGEVRFGWSNETFVVPEDFDDPLPDEFWTGETS